MVFFAANAMKILRNTIVSDWELSEAALFQSLSGNKKARGV